MTVNVTRFTILNAVLAVVFAIGLTHPAWVLADEGADQKREATWSIAIHGGAGTITRERMTPELEAEYKAALQNALDTGAAILANGGTATDAIKAAIVLLEDDPKFNAGRGAVYTWDGENELDASIMDGSDRSAGAVTGVTSIKNPILLADTVRTESVHVFLSGKGAEEFAAGHDIETAGPEWFATERRKRSLERVKAEEISALDVDHKFGTVGAVALDQHGNLAAGTSTGGMTGKRWGRIGDSPVIGAGTYADNRSCAVSATGWGEYFIRVGVAQSLCSRLMLFNLLDPAIIRLLDGEAGQSDEAANKIIERREIDAQNMADAVMLEVKKLGGDGGVILVTPEGHAIYSFNTAGMYRGRATSKGVNEVAIFGDDIFGDD